MICFFLWVNVKAFFLHFFYFIVILYFKESIEENTNMNTTKDEIVHPESFIIYEGLYFWYMQQRLSLSHKAMHRSHFCLLVFIQGYLENNLNEHSQDSSAVAVADIYKRDMKCDSASFNELFNIYFDKAIEGSHNYGREFYSNGYKLKNEHINGLVDLLNLEFEQNNKLSYCKIEHNNYQNTILYETPNGLTELKGKALELNNLSRKKEDELKKLNLIF